MTVNWAVTPHVTTYSKESTVYNIKIPISNRGDVKILFRDNDTIVISFGEWNDWWSFKFTTRVKKSDISAWSTHDIVIIEVKNRKKFYCKKLQIKLD